MSKARLLVPVLLACSITLYARPPLQSNDRTIYVVALDASGKPVSDLTGKDLRVIEDENTRSLGEGDAKKATEPLSVVLLLDTSQAIGASITNLRDGLQQFAKRIYTEVPGSSFTVIHYAAQSMTIAQNKTAPADIDKLVQKTFPDSQGTTVGLEGLSDAAHDLMKAPTKRRAIVMVFLDGMAEASTLDPTDVYKSLAQAGTSLWAINYQNQKSANYANSNSNTGQARDSLLQMACPAMGGELTTIRVPTALPDALNHVADMLVNQIAITYSRAGTATPKALEVQALRPGIKVMFSQTPPK